MSRYLGPKCKTCKKYSKKLFLKGDKCYTEKCPLSNRKQSSVKRKPASEYGRHLLEKQKIKSIFGITERQMERTFQKASTEKGLKGENFLKFLLRRLDNIVYQLGFASSLQQARQLINHGLVMVNGKICTIPSMSIAVGDVVTLKEKAKKMELVKKSLEHANARPVPDWLKRSDDNMTGEMARDLTAEDIQVLDVDSRLIVEFYSR